MKPQDGIYRFRGYTFCFEGSPIPIALDEEGLPALVADPGAFLQVALAWRALPPDQKEQTRIADIQPE
jgi:hypothetical protein